MTSADNTNVNPAPIEAADKPKRGRKRKVAVDEMAGQAYQVAVESSQVQSTDDTPTSAPTEPSSPVQSTEPVADPAALGAAMALDSVAQMPHPLSAYGSGCGNVLKAAREAQGLSIHEVCSQLRLGLKQIQAIEQDDFDQLPQPSIVRGFIRNYARLLNIDVNPILEAYQQIVPNKAPLPLSVRSNASRSIIDQPTRSVRPQRLLSLLVFLVLVAVAAYFYVNHIKPHTLKDATLAPDVEVAAEVEMPAPATPSAEVALQPTAPVNVDAAPSPQVTENSNAAMPTTEPSPSLPSSDTSVSATAPSFNTNTVVSTPTPATVQAAEKTTLSAPEPQKTSLVFKVKEESWVRIEDMQGKKLFSEVLPAGSERQVTAEKPVNITVGHASGTLLTIDNQPYDLTQATRGRVARIQLK